MPPRRERSPAPSEGRESPVRAEDWPSHEDGDASYSGSDEHSHSGDATATPRSGNREGDDYDSDEDGEYESDGDYSETGSDHSSDGPDARSPSRNTDTMRSSAPPASSPVRPPATPAPAADLSSIIAFLTHVLGSQHRLAPEEHASLQRFWLALVQRLDAQQAHARLSTPAVGSPAAASPTPRRRAPTRATMQPPSTALGEVPMSDIQPSDAHLTSLLQRLLEQQPAPAAPPPRAAPTARSPQPVEGQVLFNDRPAHAPDPGIVDAGYFAVPTLPPLPPIPPLMPAAEGVLPPLVPPVGMSSPPPPSGGVSQPFALMDLESDDEQDPDFDPQQMDPQFDQAGQEDWLWDPKDLEADLAALMEDASTGHQPTGDDIGRALALTTMPLQPLESEAQPSKTPSAIPRRDSNKDSNKDDSQETSKEIGQEVNEESNKETREDCSKETGKDVNKDTSKECCKVSGNDPNNDFGKDSTKDFSKNPSKDASKETDKETDKGDLSQTAAEAPAPVIVKRKPGRPRKYATNEETIAAQRMLTRNRRRQEKVFLENLKRELSETKEQLAQCRNDAALQASHVQRLITDNTMLLNQLGSIHQYLATLPAQSNGLPPVPSFPIVPPPPTDQRKRVDSPPPESARTKRPRRRA